MLPPGLKNPFGVHKADDTATLPPGDVPELHVEVLERCRFALRQTRDTDSSVGLLVVGEAGSGKSHLIAQYRKELAADPKAVLAAIRLGGAYSGRLWRHFRERLVTELLRQYPDTRHGANGLLRILRNRCPKWAAAQEGAAGGLLDWLVGRSKSGDSLQPPLDDLARTCPLDYGLQKVLPKLASPELTTAAHAWLRGQPLGAEDLSKLGLPGVFPSEQEQENGAREVVLSILRLAGPQTTLFLCFDEVEAIQAGNWDDEVLRRFTTFATELLGETGPRVVATFIRLRLQVKLRGAAFEVSNVQKMGQLHVTVPPLSWEQAVRLVRARLEAEPTCRAARQQQDADWPVGTQFVQTTYDQARLTLTPRHLILACHVEFERLRKGKPPEPAEKDEKEPEAVTVIQEEHEPKPQEGKKAEAPADFSRMWDRHSKKHLERLQGLQFDAVMAIGLPWLIEVTESPLVRVQDTDHRFGDVNLVFQPKTRGQKAVGISFCNHEPRTLWRRLDRVRDQWTAAKNASRLGSLVVLRSEAERLTSTAEERLTALKTAGARVVLVDRQQLAELAAFQAMLTAVLKGDLTRDGKPVEEEEYNAWAKGSLSEAVKEFFHVVFEPDPTPPAVPATGGKRKSASAARK